MAGKSEAEVADELRRRLEEIEALKEQALRRGLAFASPAEEQLVKRSAVRRRSRRTSTSRAGRAAPLRAARRSTRRASPILTLSATSCS
jgi:hypothetical protein